MKILNVQEKNIISKIQNALRKGQVLILPCDTVYGLFCNACNEEAVRRIFEIKGRDFNKPIGIFVKDIEMAKAFAEIDKKQERFLRKYWPGRITFILKLLPRSDLGIYAEVRPRQSSLSILVGAEKTIGIRIPDHQLFQDLYQEIDFPLAQTSANISNQPATTKIQEVINYFRGEEQKPDIIIDAGDLPQARSSTVVDLAKEKPKILRQGEVRITAL